MLGLILCNRITVPTMTSLSRGTATDEADLGIADRVMADPYSANMSSYSRRQNIQHTPS